MVYTYCQETASAEVSRKTLGQQPQREYKPEAVQSDAVSQRRLCRVTHAKYDGPEPLEHRQCNTGKDVQQEEVHQEEKERATKSSMAGIHPDKIPVEDRIEQTAAGNVQTCRNE